MARQKNIKQSSEKRPDVKNRWNYFYLLAISILLFFVSAVIDEDARKIFENINMPFIDLPLSIITNFGVVLVVFLVVPSIVMYKKNRKAFYFLIMSFASSFLFAFFLKLIAVRQRPLEIIYYPLINIINYSFPSMHSMVMFALLPFLMHFMPRQRRFWLILAILVAFTRIYFSFHYLSDVIFGIIVGCLIGELFLKLYEKKGLWQKSMNLN